jgi:signal transduction histidine kinase
LHQDVIHFSVHLISTVMYQGAPFPDNEAPRLQSLLSYEILDTEAEADFDNLVKLASQICEAPISLITLLDSERQWFKAKVGMHASETPRAQAFCGYAIHSDELMEVKDAEQDARFRDNPLVLGDPQIRFYAGMPLITPEGHRLGTLCVIDSQPRALTEAQRFALRTLARQVSAQLELRRQVVTYRQALTDLERHRQRLQELNLLHDQLLSVMAHDLRSPLANLGGYLQILREGSLTPAENPAFLETMHQQVLASTELLDQMLHWASLRLLGEHHQREDQNLHDAVSLEGSLLAQAMSSKDNRLYNRIDPGLVFDVEVDALRFVLRNLLLNANKFTQQGEITVTCTPEADGHRVSVQDTGVGMTPAEVQRIKQSTKRHSQAGTHQERGFGLGLILCQDFVKELGGELDIESEKGQGSRFSFFLHRNLL